ncbi:basic form of pathogenesis-related protein 1 [Cucumis sativus]|uniref:basic form of pathogenesis-related protein 1 n=1 Tax=Cucumis sativus TaxID=3659 RepID=UPI0002B43450|nr:basic form of pathogenesis-related protein 1 [Cucumis sativus]
MALATTLSALCIVALALTPIVIAQNSPQDFFDAHNAVRAKVGAEPLFWDEELEAYAKNYITSKIKTCEMVHFVGPYGENLATANPVLTAAASVNTWAAEKKYYNHNSNKCEGGECRHYRQLVWKNSFLVGCATVKCKNNWSLVSCNYSPSGNVVGERPY